MDSAHISRCGRYRYDLRRWWGIEGYVNPLGWVMLNPSTADAETDDLTIKKCVGFARRWNFDGIRVVNLFAYRATDPADLIAASDPHGDVGIAHSYVSEVSNLDCCVVAWGSGLDRVPHDPIVHPDYFGGEPNVVCLGTTKTGHPRHPSRLGYDTLAVPW